MGSIISNDRFLIVLVISGLFGSTCLAQINTIPAFFVFGDSIADAGNNNYVPTLAKGNFFPNGIDFGKPTGRFTNGKTIIDIMGQELGLKDFIPPYLAPTTVGDVIFRGVNYASGAAGILNATGKISSGPINMDAQIGNFANTRRDIISRIGDSATDSLLSKALLLVTVGANDLLNYYFMSTSFASLVPWKKPISPEMFVDKMISRLRLQLTKMYNLGARKIVVANMPPLGCIPWQREINPTAGESCDAYANQLATLYNNRLKSLITDLTSNLVGSKFVYADIYRILLHVIENFQSYGFENANSGCCHVGGRFGDLMACTPASKVCSNRSKYVFWDLFHPTEATCGIIAKRMLDGNADDIFPINVRQLFHEA